MTRFFILLMVVGCGASTPVPQYAGISEKQYVEARELPPRPDADPIAKEDDWVKPLPAGQCADRDGVLLSPEKAVRAALYKDGYNNLRNLYDIDRQVWTQHRIVYNERTAQANAEIKRLAPSWWDEQKTSISWAAGFALGAATTILIVYSVDSVKNE
jgi:hypothetical protein